MGEPVSQANSTDGAAAQGVETPEVVAEVRPGKLVLTIDSKVLAEITVHEDTNKLECQLVKPPKTWFGGKAGQQKRFAEAKRKFAELSSDVDEARAMTAAKVVKQLKKAARERDVGLTDNPAAPIRNVQLGKLLVVAGDAIRAAYVPGYMAYKVEKKDPARSSSEPKSTAEPQL